MFLDPDPPDFPADWAIAWGEDAYGIWQAFAIGGVRQVMRWIPPGRFEMGSPPDEPDRWDNETLHTVTLTRGYWLAETACTQALWEAVTGSNPARFHEDPENPVEQVSWYNVQSFIEAANEMMAAGLRLRLPTEAEWEYACRAGTRTPFNFGSTLTTDRANYDGNYPYDGGAKGEFRERTVPVHSFAPNRWGLYQMHGNVWEWCADGASEEIRPPDYPADPVVDPIMSAEARGRVLRGGSWLDDGRGLRSAGRYADPPDYRSGSIGLRLAGGSGPRQAGWEPGP